MDSGCVFPDSIAHIRTRLDYLDLLLRRALVIARASRPSTDPEAFRGLMISDETVDGLLDTVTLAGESHKTCELLADLDQQIAKRCRDDGAPITADDGQASKPSLWRLADIFGLGKAEADLVLIALAPELETRYETIYAYLQNDVTRKRPGVELALDLICRDFEQKIATRHLLAAGAPLLHFRIVELGEDAYDRRPTLLRRFLKLDEAVIQFLLEQPPAASPGVRMLPPPRTAPVLGASAATRQALDGLARALQSRGTRRSVLQICGKAEAPLEQAAIALGFALDRPLLLVEAPRLAEDVAAAVALVRDAALRNALPVLVYGPPPDAVAERARLSDGEGQFWAHLQEAGLGAVVLGGVEDPSRFPAEFQVWRVVIEPPDFAERSELWRAATRDCIPDADPERLADMFTFGTVRLQRAIALAHMQAALRSPTDPAPTMADVMQAARTIATPNLQRFAVTVTPRYDWDDLVLPSDRSQQLRTVAARVGNRQIVQRDWGFDAKLSRGRGVAVLFSGPPGTGKTMAAEVLAHALSLDLFQIDLSTVVSKYIGETEKQFGRHIRTRQSAASAFCSSMNVTPSSASGPR